MKTPRTFIYFAFGLLAFVCFALSPAAQAVVPPPDGGYPNFTTAEGENALKHLTGGVGNTGIGTFSLFSVSTGNFNTAVGAGALDFNTADSNTATGAAALLFNTTGTENTAHGTAALEFNDSGSNNTAIGFIALTDNTTGDDNTATGFGALGQNTTGFENTASGVGALNQNTSGFGNTATGDNALQANIAGNNNTADGAGALFNATGTGNTAFGAGAGAGVTTANNVICLGSQGANVSDSCYIGNIFGAGAISGDAVFVTSAGKLGTVTIPSAARFKEEIKPMNKASDVLFALKPVTFRYKEEFDPQRIPQFGLVAEEVEKVNPDLVKRDHDGKLQTVRYDAVNAMLLNEFLKEHKTVQEQGATITRLQKQIEALTAGLQKVSAQLEVKKPAPQTVLNTQ